MSNKFLILLVYRIVIQRLNTDRLEYICEILYVKT